AYLEDHVREVFERKLTEQGKTWRPRLDLKAAVEAGPHPEHPHLRASLDAFYEIDGELVITDFKAPSETSLDSYRRYGDFDDYVAQLNHYKVVAKGHGVRVDRLLLAMYDYRRVASVGCEVFDIPDDPALQNRIIEASAELWNAYILQGLIP